MVPGPVHFYLPLRVNMLHIHFIILVILLVGPHANSSVSRVTSLMSTVAPGLMAAKSLSQFILFYLPVFYHACARTYWYTVVGDIPRPRTSLGGAASPLPHPRSVVQEGCVCHAFLRHAPFLKMENLMKKMRRIRRIR